MSWICGMPGPQRDGSVPQTAMKHGRQSAHIVQQANFLSEIAWQLPWDARGGRHSGRLLHRQEEQYSPTHRVNFSLAPRIRNSAEPDPLVREAML